jgi:TetR/AcrR family transcriptional repressor of mexJK operon
MTPLPGRPKDLRKHEQILDAAELHFMKLGYEGTSMDAVARDAEVSKITIYSHFADKAELFQAVIARKCEFYARSQDYDRLVDAPLEKALSIIGRNFVALILSDEAISMHRIVESESLRHSQVATAFYDSGPKRLKAALHSLISHWVQHGQLRIDDIELAIDHLLSMLKGEAHMRRLLNLAPIPDQRSIDRHIASVVGVFLAAYGGKVVRKKRKRS